MKLGDFFVELGIKSDSKSIKAVEEHINGLKKLQKEVKREIQLEKELAEAQTDEQKARIKKKYALEKEIDVQEENLKQQKSQIANFKGMIKGAIGVASAVAVAIGVIDRMTIALARSNQRLMNFQHQTGISISTLNKYANANVAVNPLASIEGTASSLQNVASNLWDIQLGRGDVSAYQELSYFSGQQVEPYGKSLEQVIESVRSALRKIPNDIQATNLIQRMGFSADDLQMLRMTKKEFEEIQDIMLSSSQRKELEKYGKQLNIIHLKCKTIYETLIIKLAPYFIKFLNTAYQMFTSLLLDVDIFIKGLNQIGINLKFVIATLASALVIFAPQLSLIIGLFLVIEDILSHFAGKESYFGDFLNWLSNLDINDMPLVKSIKNIGNAINTSFIGQGFNNLDKIMGLFSFLNPINFASAGALAFQNLGNSTGNVSNKYVNNIDINTNNPAVIQNLLPNIQFNNAKAGG